MSERIGLLTKKQQKYVAKLADKKVKLKGVLELVDGQIFKFVIAIIDDKLLEKIPQDWQNPLEPIIDAAIEGKWDVVELQAGNLLTDKVDIPGVNEQHESVLFNGVIQLILGLVLVERDVQLQSQPDPPHTGDGDRAQLATDPPSEGQKPPSGGDD